MSALLATKITFFPSLYLGSILPFFQVALVLSFLILLYVVSRLYRGIRILNARVDILSTIVKNLRKEIQLTAGIDEVVFDEFDTVEAELQNQLQGEFSMRGSSASLELPQVPIRGRSLVRSSLDLDAVGAQPETDTPPAAKAPAAKNTPVPPGKRRDLETYEAKESGLNVEIKSDMSYIATPESGHHAESIALPDLPPPDEESSQQDKPKETT